MEWIGRGISGNAPRFRCTGIIAMARSRMSRVPLDSISSFTVWVIAIGDYDNDGFRIST